MVKMIVFEVLAKRTKPNFFTSWVYVFFPSFLKYWFIQVLIVSVRLLIMYIDYYFFSIFWVQVLGKQLLPTYYPRLISGDSTMMQQSLARDQDPIFLVL